MWAKKVEKVFQASPSNLQLPAVWQSAGKSLPIDRSKHSLILRANWVRALVLGLWRSRGVGRNLPG